jgi:hypothetical protein
MFRRHRKVDIGNLHLRSERSTYNSGWRSTADLLAAPLGPTSRVFRRRQIWPNCEAHGVAAVKMDDDDEYFPDLTALHYPGMMLQK